MKNDRPSLFFSSVIFLFGALVSFILSQYKLLEIDDKLNVPETLMSIITALIGLYIAVNLQKRQVKNQNLYNYVMTKFEDLWKISDTLSLKIESHSSILVSDITKEAKLLYKKIDFLKRVATSFDISGQCFIDIETAIDSLESTLTNSTTIANNNIDYSSFKTQVESLLDQIEINFTVALRQLNNIV